MNTITVKDGTQIYYKDWGTGQPLFFHHGWPLSADDWDEQMMFFLERGYRVIAHDRRGHGRSTQTVNGNEMDTYAADVAELVEKLNLRDAIHIGHSTGGGEVARYVARYGKGRVAKAILISAVPPIMVKSAKNPGGLPIEVFDKFRQETANNRAQFFQDVTLPFYGYNRPGAKISQGVRDNWWRQGMMGGIKAQYDCIKAFSETDFTEDLKKNRRSHACHARRRRPDCPVCRRWTAIGEAAEKRDDEVLSRLPPRHADNECGADQCRPARIRNSVSARGSTSRVNARL